MFSSLRSFLAHNRRLILQQLAVERDFPRRASWSHQPDNPNELQTWMFGSLQFFNAMFLSVK
jgi:hypothetical protein